MNLSGLGESEPRVGQPHNAVFPPGALEDIRAAIDLMRSRFAARDITLAGLCSGAYHSLRAAVAGLPVNRVLLINPENFFWKEGSAITDIQLTEIVRGPGRYRQRMLSEKAWRKLLTGKVDVARITRVYAERFWLAFMYRFRNLARMLRIKLPQDLGRELEQVAARGVQVVFVFSRGEIGLELLKLQAGSSVKRLADRCRVHVIDGADHIFSQSAPRRALESLLSDELFAPSPACPKNSAGSIARPPQKPAAVE
jgi:hypothetical protein